MTRDQLNYLAGVLETTTTWKHVGNRAQMQAKNPRWPQYMAATYGGTCEQIPNKRLWIWKLDLPSRLRLFNEVEPYFNVFIESECDYIRDRFYAEIERLRKRSLGG